MAQQLTHKLEIESVRNTERINTLNEKINKLDLKIMALDKESNILNNRVSKIQNFISSTKKVSNWVIPIASFCFLTLGSYLVYEIKLNHDQKYQIKSLEEKVLDLEENKQ